MEKECYHFEHGTTAAFNLYAENILLFEIDDEKYLGHTLWLNNGEISEIHLRELITIYLTDKVANILPNWQDIRRKYAAACGKIPYNDFETKFPIYENKLKTIAKLKYCTDILKNLSNTASYELDSSSYLMAIYYKLTGLACGQNHTNPCVKPKITNKKERKNALHNNPIFKYLMLASSESYSSNINYKQLYNTPINKLVDNLFKYIIVTQFNFAKSVVEPWLGINEDGEITQQFQTLYVHDEGINSEDDAIKYAENVFDNWLIEKMHSITWYNYSNQTLD